jgi:GT2 family glycosyltransferase
VVVVDSGSFDGCAEMLALEFPEVDFVQSPENVGFGRANNLGFGKVTGEALLLLNPDTELRPGALEVLLENLRKLPEVGLIGARLLNSDETLQLSSVHSLPTAWNIALDSDWRRRRWWSKKGPLPGAGAREVEAVSGACMLLRSETFLELGGFDPKYFMYAEDMDLCFKIRRSGLKIYHASQARVLHHGGGSSCTQFSKFSAVMIREALGVYILSNHGYLQMCVYRLLMALSAVLRISLLFASLVFVTEENRLNSRRSILKWWTILRWCLGLESWAKSQFRMALF